MQHTLWNILQYIFVILLGLIKQNILKKLSDALSAPLKYLDIQILLCYWFFINNDDVIEPVLENTSNKKSVHFMKWYKQITVW